MPPGTAATICGIIVIGGGRGGPRGKPTPIPRSPDGGIYRK